MPFPLGHTAIGLAAFETAHPSEPCRSRLASFIYVVILANLPDLDILVGLLANGNGYSFHRGPTHSLLFAILAGFIASRIGRVWQRIPNFGFGLCALLVFSHVAADLFLTSSPVSLLWPFELHWSTHHSGWDGVLRMALFQSIQDFVIAAVALAYIYILRLLRGETRLYSGLFALARRIYK